MEKQNNEKLKLQEEINHKKELWHTAIKNYEHSLNQLNEYIQRNKALSFNDKLTEILKRNSRYNIDTDVDSEDLKLLYKEPIIWQHKNNNLFYKKEAKVFEEYFKTVESNPLTEAQQKAVMANELNNLVLAGAGSGKTSVVIARIGYLVKKKMAQPEDILVLAFNNDAAKEVKERIQEKLGLDVEAITFHRYGNKIYNSGAIKKSPCSFAASPTEKLRSLLTDMLQNDQEFYNEFVEYFMESFQDTRPLFDFKNKDEYDAYAREKELKTLEGSLVRSSEELTISNFLTLNSIKHEYEKDYEYNTATIEKRQYKPDFYLSDYKIYIEHFGINKKGETAPYIDSQKYNEDMRWKIELHKEKNTILVQSFSHEMSDGILLSSLKEKLEHYGVQFTPLPFEDVLKKFHEEYVIDNFTKLIEIFMNHFKSNNLTTDELNKRIQKKQKREKSFISIFDKFLRVYEQHKSTKNCIDFHDMILQANKSLKEKEFSPRYKYIIVDEFQDISIARNLLVTLTRAFIPNSIVTVVGDDWQAINQFAGSDLGIIKDFSHHYGDTETIKLDKTFRFDNNVGKIATHFIMKNEDQIEKIIDSHSKVNKPTIFLYWYDEKDKDYLDNLISHICDKHQTKERTLMILGRNKYAFPNTIEQTIKKFETQFFKSKENRTKKGIRKMTAHKSKGLEDDFVILAGLKENIIGFPTKIESDSILNIVLSSPEKIEFAEERRLFYVAFTRVKKELYLAVEQNSPSSFIKEILKDFPNDIVQINKRDTIDVPCPKCPTGIQKKHITDNGKFISCTNFPKCTFKVENIPKCDKCGAIYYIGENYYICSNKECNNQKEICPKCGGMLMEKDGKNSRVFIGCSNFRLKGCDYTKSEKR